MAELTWTGKYRDGKRVAPVRIALPFQTVETVNESTQDRGRTLDLFARGKPTEWRDRLIWGDKKYVLPSLLPELAGKVNLVYIDPPFDTGADFSFTTEIPGSGEPLLKQPSILEQKAYRDTWGGGLDSYLHWFYETALLLRDLLADDGSLYVHLDENVAHYAKAVLDEVFGQENFQREIVWRIGWISGYKSKAKNWIRNHDTILFYVKDRMNFTFNKQYIPYPPEYLRRDGKAPTGAGYPIEDVWNASENDRMDSIQIMSFSGEKVGYPTQKNENLLTRIVSTSSQPGDLVLDCFCGSGTTAAVAEKLGRRWITCDLGRFAIHTTRKRLLDIPGVKPFVVQNLGKYERQAWLAAEFDKPEDRAATEDAYRRFILELFHAESLSGYLWIHGMKGTRLVHVGSVDAPITIGDVREIARDALRASATRTHDAANAEVDVLGWEFAFELNELAREVAAETRVDVKFRRIPREVLEKKAIEQGDIQAKDFFELRALSTKVTFTKRTVTLAITDFVLDPSDLPAEVASAVKHWSQWIDYWAVDWDFKGDTFHNQWQSYRTRAAPDLELEAKYEYREPGTYRVVVKVIDLLGNDTTKMLTMEVK